MTLRHSRRSFARATACALASLTLAALGICCSPVLAADTAVRVVPAEVTLQGNFARAQLQVVRPTGGPAGQIDDRSEDLTRVAKFESTNPAVVTIDPTGRLLAVANGAAEIKVLAEGATVHVPVKVDGILPESQIGFAEHVSPLLSKLGCNLGACHASQYGKGGFVLSVFGFEPEKDREAIARDRQQRRMNLLKPEESLFLLKPTMQVAHGGGRRLEKDSVDFQLLTAWVKSGAPKPLPTAPKVTKLTVSPKQRVGTVGMTQQLRVEATYSDGQVRDVTHWARYDSMDEALLSVSPSGFVTTTGKGQSSVMVRFEGQADISMYIAPYAESVQLAGWTNHNFVDELAVKKFRELGIEPSPVCDDGTFLRRAYLDATGTLPSVEETVAFLGSADPEKRTKLVDRLLGLTGDPNLDVHNDAYAAWWALKWSDLIRNDSGTVGEQGMWALHNWLREAFRVNKTFDKVVTELVTAKGSIFSNGPANYFRINGSAPDLAENTAQLFLGVRLQCAKCHHHPFEKYSQEDYYSFAAFFARVGNKPSQEFGLFGGESVVVVRAGGEVSHPKTGKILKPTPLEADPVENPLDRRIGLAQWLTNPANEAFSKSIANRYVGYLLGRGLIEPVDDMRATNPASNPELLAALAKEFSGSGFNLKKLMRAIMVSRLYQLDSTPTRANAGDFKFYSHFKVKRLGAEALLDAIDRTAGTQTKYKSLPLGTRAIELPDAEYPDYFLKVFAKPKRASVCECERSPDENLAQALHTLNGDLLAAKIADGKGRIATAIAAKKPHDEIVRDIYLAALSRQPSELEMAASRDFLSQSPTPKEAYEDLMWAIINSKQFLYVH